MWCKNIFYRRQWRLEAQNPGYQRPHAIAINGGFANLHFGPSKTITLTASSSGLQAKSYKMIFVVWDTRLGVEKARDPHMYSHTHTLTWHSASLIYKLNPLGHVEITCLRILTLKEQWTFWVKAGERTEDRNAWLILTLCDRYALASKLLSVFSR